MTTAPVDNRSAMKRLRVWDLPTRIFHWVIALFVFGALVTQYMGGAAMDWHFRFGYGALALVIFRLIWGVVGPRYARFSSFVRGPGGLLAYWRSARRAAPLGHNPLGGLSVLSMLALVAVQTGTGLFSNDDIDAQGPLAKFVDDAWSGRISGFHAHVSGTLIYGLIALHVLAIVYYRWRKKQDLVGPMLSGDKWVDEALPAELAAQDTPGVRLLALSIAALSAGAVWLVVRL